MVADGCGDDKQRWNKGRQEARDGWQETMLQRCRNFFRIFWQEGSKCHHEKKQQRTLVFKYAMNMYLWQKNCAKKNKIARKRTISIIILRRYVSMFSTHITIGETKNILCAKKNKIARKRTISIVILCNYVSITSTHITIGEAKNILWRSYRLFREGSWPVFFTYGMTQIFVMNRIFAFIVFFEFLLIVIYTEQVVLTLRNDSL